MFLFLDYDGTLVPITREPEDAVIPEERKNFLKELSIKVNLSIVTGRSFKSLEMVFGIVPQSIFAVTSHGAVIHRDSKEIFRAEGSIPDLLPLRKRISSLNGVIFEEKDLCFAIHYRKAPELEEKVREVFEEFVKRHPPVRIIEGKMVLEALYGDFDKGKGVERVLSITGYSCGEIIYIGDDKTDLIAFEKVKELGGKTVFVGNGNNVPADLVLENVDEVYRYLQDLTSSYITSR